MFPGMGGGYGMQRPPIYDNFGPQPAQPLRPQPMHQPPRLMKEPIDRIGNYGLDRRINDVARPAPMMRTQGPESLNFGQMEFLTNKK